MRKSPFKRGWIVLLFIFLIVNLVLNATLVSFKKTILSGFNKRFPLELSVDDIFYIFPVFFTIKNAVGSLKESPSNQVFQIPFTLARISPTYLFVNREVIFSSIILFSPKINSSNLAGFFKNHSEELIELLKHIPVRNTQLHLKEGLVSSPQASSQSQLFIDYVFRMKDKQVDFKGVLRRDLFDSETKKLVPSDELNVLLHGIVENGGVSFDVLNLKSKDFESQLYGFFDKKVLQLNGFTLMDTLHAGDAVLPPPSSPALRDRFKLLNKFKSEKQVEVEKLDPNIYLLDLDCKLNIRAERIETERLWFTLNEIPVSMSGSIAFGEKTELDVTASFYPLRTKTFKDGILKQADVQVKGNINENIFEGLSRVNFYFVPNEASKLSMDKIEALMEGTRVNLKKNYFEGHVDAGQMTIWANENAHKVSWNDLTTSINLDAERYKIIKLNAPFKGGEFNGRIWVDTENPRITASGIFKDVNAEDLHDLLVHFSKVTGRMSGQMVFDSYPKMGVKGNVEIKDGSISNFDFFNWLADTFSLPSLKSVDFETTKLEFHISPDDAGFDSIWMDSKMLGITGAFLIDKDTYVHSKLSLVFSKELLKESKKFAFILKGFKEDEEIPFDFKLSGNFESMNFLWMDSPTKENIQSRIPNFIERGIDRKLERIMDSPKSEVPKELPHEEPKQEETPVGSSMSN